MNIEQLLKEKVYNALAKLGVEASLNDVVIEASKNQEHGDYASNVALKFASRVKKNPRDFASEVINAIDKDNIDKIEIAGPGFINFFMKKDTLCEVVSKIINESENYGHAEDKRKSINVEFVSANPTGDLHLGHARCAAVGDSICRLYEFAGYKVTREFYVNNAGNQIATLGMSLQIRYKQLFGEKIELPEDSYHAHDIIDIATMFKEEYGDKYLADTPENLKFITQYGMDKELEKIKRDLALFRVAFDIYSFETDVRKDNHVMDVLTNKEL